MNEKRLSIGRMAEMNHTTVPTLRLYDQKGLLTPDYTDPDTGYRYYDIKQNARFSMIQYMKELGMSLAEIQDVLNKENIQLIEDILIRKREQMFLEIRQLKQQRDAVTRAIDSIERYRKSPSIGKTFLEYIDRRRIYAIPVSVNFYEHDIETYEQVLSELREHMIDNALPQIYYDNVGTSMSMGNFMALRFVAEEIFVFVDDHFPLRENVRQLDSGMYACIYLDHYDDEKRFAETLLQFCLQNQYHIVGDYICEVLTEFNVFNSEQRSMFLRLQVPISFQTA
ncbi:MAG: helix-turn-helix domain-containing protein [Clostridia bacterium]